MPIGMEVARYRQELGRALAIPGAEQAPRQWHLPELLRSASISNPDGGNLNGSGYILSREILVVFQLYDDRSGGWMDWNIPNPQLRSKQTKPGSTWFMQRGAQRIPENGSTSDVLEE